MIALCDRQFYDIEFLPPWFTERWVALSWSILFTVVPMVLVTLRLGKEDLVADEQWKERGWLQRSREELPAFQDHDRAGGWWLNLAAIALMLACCWVTFVLFW
jgi:hypothetical protein